MSSVPAGLSTWAARWLLTAVWSFAPAALAESEGTRYHFDVTAVTAKPAVKPDVARFAIAKVQAEVKKVFSEHPRLVAKLEGAPDPRANAEAFR